MFIARDRAVDTGSRRIENRAGSAMLGKPRAPGPTHHLLLRRIGLVPSWHSRGSSASAPRCLVTLSEILPPAGTSGSRMDACRLVEVVGWLG